MNLLVSNKIVCSMGLFEGPGNEGEEFHQMFAICDEIVKILPTWDFVFKNSNEKLDKRLIQIWMGFFSLGSLFDWSRNVFLLKFLHIFAICNESMKTEDDFFEFYRKK